MCGLLHIVPDSRCCVCCISLITPNGQSPQLPTSTGPTQGISNILRTIANFFRAEDSASINFTFKKLHAYHFAIRQKVSIHWRCLQIPVDFYRHGKLSVLPSLRLWRRDTTIKDGILRK